MQSLSWGYFILYNVMTFSGRIYVSLDSELSHQHFLFCVIHLLVFSVLGLIHILALFQQPLVHSILQLLCPVVGAVLALHAEVNVGADTAVV